MTPKLKRLPLPPAVREKIAAKLRGRPRSAATKAKIAATLAGRAKSPEHRAALTAARRARPKLTVLEACRKAAAARYRAGHAERKRQLDADRLTAWRLRKEHPGLFEDVRDSHGYARRRRLRGRPGVSDGWSRLRGVEWS